MTEYRITPGTVTRYLGIKPEDLPTLEARGVAEKFAERVYLDDDVGFDRLVRFTRKCFSSVDAEQIVTDVFVNVFLKKYPQGDVKAQDSSALRALLFTAVRNKATDDLRKLQHEQFVRQRLAETSDDQDDAPDDSLDDLRQAFHSHLDREIRDEQERAFLRELLDALFQHRAGVKEEDRNRILDRLDISRSEFYRAKSRLAKWCRHFLFEQ
jgi:hypothetical protein